VNGIALDCLFDTGAPGAISIGYNAARRLGLWSDTRPFAPQATSGIGGSGGIGRIVRVDAASFGGEQFERPLVLLRGPNDGARQQDGVIGLTMLRRFNLSTEVRTHALWLQSHTDVLPLPERYGLSGMWLMDQDGAVHVAAVGPGSPSDVAGVQVGDRVRSLDFRSAIASISGAPGKNVELPLEGRGGTRVVRFTLRPFL